MANTTTVHCPDCGARVEASPDATAVACAACHTAFSPWGLPTTARRISTPPTATPHGSGTPRAPGEPEVGPSGVAEENLVGSTVGGHKLLRVLGRGGMGTVYEAEDAKRGRVAVKVLPAPLARDASFVSRFHREAKTLSGLSHPHLVEVYERGQDGDRCYFVMEYVRGESLRRVMDRGPVAWREAVRITRDVLSGLGYAHGRGVVHRDLKPENILLEADGRARLVDFGLSRIVRGEAAADLSRLTRTNVILGTYEYMAPEQRVGGDAVDERADLFALGVILYEMVTGSLPLGHFEAASRLRPGVPSSLDRVIHVALATSPKDRFPSAVAFREALDAAEIGSGAAAGDPAAAATQAAVPTEALSRMHLEAARKTLRHVEILAGCDRVLGWLLILGFFGLFGASKLTHLHWGWEWGVAGSSILLLIGGVLMLKQGRRLREMAPGSREAQVTASFFLLILFPPIGTALGIYGLIVLTSDAAREAFRVGKASLMSRSWLAREFVTPRPPTATSPGNAPTSFGALTDVFTRRSRRRGWRYRHRKFLERDAIGWSPSPIARYAIVWAILVPFALVLTTQARSMAVVGVIVFGTWLFSRQVLDRARGSVAPALTVLALGMVLHYLAVDMGSRGPFWQAPSPSAERFDPALPSPPYPPDYAPPAPGSVRPTVPHDDARDRSSRRRPR